MSPLARKPWPVAGVQALAGRTAQTGALPPLRDLWEARQRLRAWQHAPDITHTATRVAFTGDVAIVLNMLDALLGEGAP